MKLGSGRFMVDTREAKLAGVCAGLGARLGLDPTVIRIGFALAAVFASFWLAVAAYAVLAMVGQPGGARRRGRGRGRDIGPSAQRRDLDRRMAEIETYVASSRGNRLAREIDDLR